MRPPVTTATRIASARQAGRIDVLDAHEPGLLDVGKGAVGELPPEAALAQVWIDDARDGECARVVLAEHEADARRTDRVCFCPACGEDNPASFELCSRCGVGL